MPALMLTTLNDDGSVTQQCGAPLVATGSLAVEIFPGTLTVRLYVLVGNVRILLAEDDLLTMLIRGGQTINLAQSAERLRILANHLDPQP